jgi:hypothetical protein
MRFLAIISLALSFNCWNIYGQTPEDRRSQPGTLTLRIKNINFIKNNEYFNPIGESKFILASAIPGYVDKSAWIEGYTLLGFFFQPELLYKPSDKITIRAGVHLLKYSGTDKFSQIRPVFSTSLNLSEKTILTIGSLSGSDEHLMFDPHFDKERLYTAYVEDGFQLTHKSDHFFTDTWLSWENYIFNGDATREIFTFGESFRYTSNTIADLLNFEVPFQLQFKHFGGQISNYLDHVDTFFNLATGLRVNIEPAQKRFGQAGIEYLQFINSVFPARPSDPVSNGKGSWIRFHYTWKWLYLGTAFWKAHDFYAPNGNPIYASLIDFKSHYVIPDRKIITSYIYLTLFPESDLELLFGFETYYNVPLKKVDYSTTLHLNFNKLIKLATINH